MFTETESTAIAPYFTNLDGPVFGLVNLPETVKGALFARYSRSPKSLRRLFLDEFLDDVGAGGAPVASTVGTARAERLYQKVLSDFGDDSVAQLGGVHLAVEDASNLLTKVLERGRLMAYLEQSTRYIPYTDRRGDAWRYLVPAEIDDPALRSRFIGVMNAAFETYARWIDPMRVWFEARYPKAPGDSDAVYRSAIRAKALDTLRGLLPAATQSNVGIYGTGQAFETLLLRMRAHRLVEVRGTADLMLAELRKVIPAFLARVDQPERGGRWSVYLAATRDGLEVIGERLTAGLDPAPRPEVTLVDFDPDGELKVVAAALYAATAVPDDELLAMARRLSVGERADVLRASVGERGNRRHKPGRAFERTSYRFDVLTDYGAFRDLQRHRMLTLDWQALTTRHGYVQPEAIIAAGGDADWRALMDRSAELFEALVRAGLPHVAQYAVSMAYRVRFVMDMNAREAMHVIELRTAPQGHPAYRRVCQQMHRLIADVAGHRAIAAAMRFADHSAVELERLQEERRIEGEASGAVVTLLIRHALPVRFRDCDPLGHVNNAAYLTYLEQARFALWRAQLDFMARPAGAPGPRGPGFIMARAEVDFRAQARYGDELEVRLSLETIGRTSFTYAYEVVLAPGDRLVAAAKTVQVWFDYDAERPVPIPDDLRVRLARPVL